MLVLAVVEGDASDGGEPAAEATFKLSDSAELSDEIDAALELDEELLRTFLFLIHSGFDGRARATQNEHQKRHWH